MTDHILDTLASTFTDVSGVAHKKGIDSVPVGDTEEQRLQQALEVLSEFHRQAEKPEILPEQEQERVKGLGIFGLFGGQKEVA